MSDDAHDALLTLEPLIEAVRLGVEASGWALSGLQKTTSHQFEGRWAGDSTRSAYLFFHLPGDDESASLDVFLDETSRGLSGNLALVLDGPTLGELRDVPGALERMSELARRVLPRGFRTPLTLRFHLEGVDVAPPAADTELRFKVRIPRGSILEGENAVADMARATATALRVLLDDPGLGPLVASDTDPE